jgi:calcineurin-like phosphoesterase family protein
MIENINKVVTKHDKLFILGDLAFSDKGMQWVNSIRCRNVELILGNHDMYPVRKYLDLGFKVHGFRGYKNYWLSHCPIHPQEVFRKRANIHGHIHKFGSTDRCDPDKYFCVNPEYWNLGPVSLEQIDNYYEVNK